MNTLYDPGRVLADVSALAYVIADVRSESYSPHTLHNLFDIAEPGNVERAENVMCLAAGEVEALLSRHNAGIDLTGVSCRATLRYLRRLIHEYIVACVLLDWLRVAFPPIAAIMRSGSVSTAADNPMEIWKEKKRETYAAIAGALRGTGRTFTRRVPPI